MFDVNIVSTGSVGNLNIIDGVIAIDVGIPVRDAVEHLPRIEHVLVSHRHRDHLNPAMIHWFMRNRPAIMRYGIHMNESCWQMIEQEGKWGVQAVPMSRTEVLDGRTSTQLRTSKGVYRLDTYPLVHNVPIQGFVLTNPAGETLIHATDTETMRHAPRARYDYLLIEGNWDEDRLYARIDEAVAAGDEDGLRRAMQNFRHLSVQDCANFITQNSKPGSRAWQLHESDAFGMTLGYHGVDESKMLKAVRNQ